jgi:hypothetical protein
MPRFYLDGRGGSRFTPDDEGLEFPGLDAAEREAATAATETGRDRLPSGDTRDVTVEVRNEHGQRMLTVRVTLEIEPYGATTRGSRRLSTVSVDIRRPVLPDAPALPPYRALTEGRAKRERHRCTGLRPSRPVWCRQ